MNITIKCQVSELQKDQLKRLIEYFSDLKKELQAELGEVGLELEITMG